MMDNQASIVPDAGSRFHYLEPLGGTSDNGVIKEVKGYVVWLSDRFDL